jgi:cellobiose phosphorylase
MLYLYLAALLLIIVLIFYRFTRKNQEDEYNIMEDIPIINMSKEGLEKHAIEIAGTHSSSKNTSSKRKLIKSLDKSYRSIIKAYEYIDIEAKNRREMVPAAEWMLDNIYLIEKGLMKGYPRVYSIAIELISHSDGMVTESTLEGFIHAYQSHSVLTSGELWALPIMVRIALIQNISKVTDKIQHAQNEKKRGDALAERLINAFNEHKLFEELKKIDNEHIKFSPYFTERFLKVLRDNGIDNAGLYKWIDEKLEENETNSEKMINIEHQKQAGFQLSIGNSINSIREIAGMNWRDNFERLSYVENALKHDPADIYSKMDFESRDYYRHKVEKLAKLLNSTEAFIAKKAIECAALSEEKCEEAYKRHVGYYLIDNGEEKLKDYLGFKEKGILRLERHIKNNITFFYIGTILILTILLSLLVISRVMPYYEGYPTYLYIIALIAILIPCSEIVNSILNWSINYLSNPRIIPKLSLKDGIPEEFSSIVVIPTLLSNEKRVKDLIGDLEVYHLANEDRNLYFALLGDFKDSDTENDESDNNIVKVALKEIKELNKKYASDGKDIFYFFNRYRQFNEKENKWLGWERKRGKLMEFNSLLKGDKNTSYNIISGDINNLNKVKYVITLDADTQLPRDSARKLIGAMSHVLNRPYLNESGKKVLRGYGLMQPRIGVGTIEANKTLFSKIFSGETGIDIYTTAVSDVYQDLFGEGIFTGKGIYDVDVFEKVLKNEIPENTILSHDLLEGSYVRTGLVTDIELIDGYPAYYNSSSMRLHRWTRGDWQLIPWLFKKSVLNGISKWKIIDNLRRSLLAPSIIILIILSASILPTSEQWLIVAFLAILCPIFFDVSEAVVSPIKGISLSGRISSVKTVVEQIFLIFCFLPYQSYLMLDAVIRTLYRLTISKKNMLEWQTAADVEAKLEKKFTSFIAAMWPGSIIAIAIITLSAVKSVSITLFMLPSCVLWIISPYIAYYISLNRTKEEIELSDEQLALLRKIARKTWAYFEDFVESKNNWLSPDNYQEDPPNGVAERTSPTNMAMGLTSNIVAFDLGYIDVLQLVERLDRILTSMESLTRYKGHFYNWYDTSKMEPLYPRYISTVDSGNLVGYLWLMEESIEEYKNQPLITRKKYKGLCDTLRLCSEEIEEFIGTKDFYNGTLERLENSEVDLIEWKKILGDLWGLLLELEDSETKEELYWNNKARWFVKNELKQLQVLLPWSELISKMKDSMKDIKDKLKNIAANSSLLSIYEEIENMEREIHRIANNDEFDSSEKEMLQQLIVLLQNGKRESIKIIERMNNLKSRLSNMAECTDFSMLYDKKRQLFAIGYDIERDSLGNSYYDLLASESRQASFVAIAKGDVEQKHWFRLGRAMALIGKNKGLVSWSGTMFEYFMPLLIMKNFPDTLLNETYESVVEGQKKYASDKKVPWGISESAFYNFDPALNYQYKAFGVPGIGLKRGLSNELVISPYSTIMALQMDTKGAYENLKKLAQEGIEGKYGFYEAVDYTKDRMPKGKNKAIVKCFMIHHEGMSIMSLDNVLNKNILQQRFHNIPRVKATELLLQERVPRKIIYDREQEFDYIDFINQKQNVIVRNYSTAKTNMPQTHLLGNGSYALMITNSGSGYSKKEDMTVYRWREDITLDNTGLFFYIKNINSNEYWSATYEPCRCEGDSYEVTFSLDKAEFKRQDGNLITHTEVAVSNEEDAEVRRISITNHSEHSRVIELTSYCEITLAPYNADIVHPTFSNLFIQTEYIEETGCIIASRRPRAKGQKKPYAVQTVAVEGNVVGSIQYETSRINFLGRGRDVSDPVTMENDAPLKNTAGAVLDPIISLRRRIKIEPGETCRVAYTMAVTESRDEAIEIAKKYNEIQNVNRVFELAWTQSQVEMKYLGIKSNQANLYQLIASRIIFMNTQMREREEYIKSISKHQSSLWPYGISGDLPILLLILRQDKDIDLVRQVLIAHEYWSIKGLKVDLVILNLQQTVYVQPLLDSIRDLISSSHARDKQNKSSGVFLHSKATMAEEDVKFITAIARLVIDSENGSIINQIKDISIEQNDIDEIKTENIIYDAKPYRFESKNLEYFNGIGGFDTEENQYVIRLKDNKNTPAPWINVISNQEFGFHISESGSAYTWYKNSRENKLTPWGNDPITDPATEALYLRDEVSGDIWSITAKPIRDRGEYVAEHGFGYSNFKHEAQGIVGEVTYFTPINESLKLGYIKLKNNTDMDRMLSLTYFAQLTIGVYPQQTAQYISTYLKDGKYIYAQNPYSEHFGKAYTYLAMLGVEDCSFTGNRKEFIGRNGNMASPEALKKLRLSNNVGAGFDPCACVNGKINIPAGAEVQVVILFGANEDIGYIDSITEIYSSTDKVQKSLEDTKNYWKQLLGTVKVKTPDKTMDILLNGWLMYQTIACRYWSRTAFYQSGGAMGFRDQLQDSMAIGFLNSDFTKNQILHSASRQFIEGDVQHWWHPVVNSGIRTRFSDDLLWLPFVTIDYIKNTGDYSILDEMVIYLDEEPLQEGEDERYKVSRYSDIKGAIYEHCVKTIDLSLRFGEHNIPLMGSGDWNDGMSTVGNEGKGESVWLGWFIYNILNNFIDLCKYKGDIERANRYEEAASFIRENMEKNAWDGSWYRRAYCDDGTPLGSIENDECQIDSLAQSWSVISGAAKESRAKEAMEAVEKYLVKEDKGMVLLLTPPFDKSKLEPGYIKGYVAGVRENGGQYTHAATWVILAFAKLGYGKRAWEIFHMINPINHTKSHLDCERYKVEPYVMAADVYAREPHEGRGGWSWYTGTSGWMYRVGIENMLGLRLLAGKGFTINPCIPEEWPQYEMEYTYKNSTYEIQVIRGDNKGIYLDGNIVEEGLIPYMEQGKYKVQVII